MASLTIAKMSLVANVMEFFTEEIINDKVIGHDKQRLKEIIKCLKDIYSINEVDKSKLKKYNLLSIFLEQSNGVEDDTLNEAEHHKEVGDVLMNRGSFDKAVKQYTTAIEINPMNASYFYNRALAFSELHKYSEAIQDCQKAISFNSKYAAAYSLLGSVYVKTENYKEALKSFEKCTVIEPRNAVYREKLELVRVQVQKSLGGCKNNKRSLLPTVEIKPIQLPLLPPLPPLPTPKPVVVQTETPEKIADNFRNLAEQAVNKNCYEKAIFFCTKIIEQIPNSARNFCNRAEVHLYFGNNEACIEDCKSALTLCPTCGVAYDTIGIAFTNVRNFADAFKAFSAAVTYEPNVQKFKDDFRTAQGIYAEHLKATQAQQSSGMQFSAQPSQTGSNSNANNNNNNDNNSNMMEID